MKMDFIKNLFAKKNLKKIGSAAIALLLLIVVIIAFRSCGKAPIGRSKDLYFIGRDPSFYPLQIAGRERLFLGFINDFMAEIAAESHLRIEWVDTSPSTLLQGLDKGNYDAAITALRPNIVNQEKYVFSEMLFELGPVLIVRKDSKLHDLKQMQGHTIAVSSGLSLIFNGVRETGADIYSLTFVTYDSINKALESLANGYVDAAIIPAIPAYSHIQSFYSDKIKIVSAPLADEGIRLIALRSERSEKLINAFDALFEKYTDDNTFKKYIDKWGLIDPSIEPPH